LTTKTILASTGAILTLAGGIWYLSNQQTCTPKTLWVCASGQVQWTANYSEAPNGCQLVSRDVCDPNEVVADCQQEDPTAKSACEEVARVKREEVADVLNQAMSLACAPCRVTRDSSGPCPGCILTGNCADICPAQENAL
jgi:hypothetical protein